MNVLCYPIQHMGEVLELARTPTEADEPTIDEAQLLDDPTPPEEEPYDPLKEPSRLLKLHPESFSLAFAQAIIHRPGRRIDNSGYTQFFWENPTNVDTNTWR